MTGYNVRIFRDGSWQNLDLVELTDEEFDAFALRRGADDGWSFAKALAKWIRDHVEAGSATPVPTGKDWESDPREMSPEFLLELTLQLRGRSLISPSREMHDRAKELEAECLRRLTR